MVDSYHTERLRDDVQERVLNDGSRFEVVKRYWQPAELEAVPGWRLTTKVTAGQAIVYGWTVTQKAAPGS